MHARIESDDDNDQEGEDINPPKRRRTFTASETQQGDDGATAVQTSLRHSFPSMDSNSLRRSKRGSALRSGPKAYNLRWHPIDDFKASKRNGRKKERSDSPNLKTFKTSKAPQEDGEGLFQSLVHHGKSSSTPPRRRSARNVYTAETAMKYDMKRHWSLDNVNKSDYFAKKLEEQRRALVLASPRVEASDIQLKSLELQKGKTRKYHSEVYVKGNTSEDGSTHSENGPIRRRQTSPLSPDVEPAAASMAVDLPLALDEDFVR